MSSNKKSAPNSLPKWITEHFNQALDTHGKLFQIVHISEKGIGILRKIPQLARVLAKTEDEEDAEATKKRLVVAEREAALAESEIELDYPVLHSFAVVALWSWMESLVKGLATIWILNRRDAYKIPAIQRLKVKVGDFTLLSKQEQAAYLVELLEQDIASPLKKGVNRFESLLEPFGLTGSLPPDCAKQIFELQQIRNVIVHCNGRADKRLRAECPWLKLKLHQPVHVTRPMLQGYSNAAGQYLLELLYRLGDSYELDLRSRKDSSSQKNAPSKAQ